jgi:CubicO group peptidase (beta-lactamase class C family)
MTGCARYGGVSCVPVSSEKESFMNARWRRGRIALIALIGLTQLCVGADPNEKTSGSIADILSSLRELTQVPAFSVAIVRNGQVLAQSAVGEIDTRNHIDALPEHRFRLASVSKTVGATMLALLVQRGDLDPGAPISDYIDDLPEQYRHLTALQLLSHTSGLPHYQARDALIAKTHYNTAIDALASVGDRPLISTPGDSYVYSSHGYTILSALYETVSGETLGESAPAFVEKLTARESPAIEDLQRRDSRRSNVFAVGAYGAKTLKPRDQSYSPFATGFVASATDLAYFGDAVLHSPQIDEKTRELLFRPVTLTKGGKTGRYFYEVAFGWRVGKDLSGRTVYHHAGVTEGARSVLILYPESGLSIAFLSNAAWTAQIERTGFALANIVLEKQSPASTSGSHDFTGFFDGHEISGTLACVGRASTCRFSDNLGALSEWLMQYSPNKELKMGWPSLLVQGDSGYALKVVTSVGVIELQRTNTSSGRNSFQAELGNGRVLVINFSGTCLPKNLRQNHLSGAVSR